MFIIFMLQLYLTPSLLSIDVIKRVEDRKMMSVRRNARNGKTCNFACLFYFKVYPYENTVKKIKVDIRTLSTLIFFVNREYWIDIDRE